ncbi:TrbC/VirB2 family protein [Neisseria sp. Ec49-e6-T10]|uniref:TrbC/VirB2 family protein n=1 Tax=Neisseria sp. Ec49-e6-T10 TaxID=3140744 RepID=UPI003EC0CD74
MKKTHMIQDRLMNTLPYFVMLAVMAVFFVVSPEMAYAQGGGGAQNEVQGFFQNIEGLLSIASISVVTIAFIWVGYKLAFGGSRFIDVAPVLFGALLVGGALEFAKMIVGS